MEQKPTWIQTYSGRQFFPLSPRVEDIFIEDIAHALSLICRFAGHCKQFYSVAEHCVRASNEVYPEYALRTLLHDASEAYLYDLASPLKAAFPIYRKYESALSCAISLRFKILFEESPYIKSIDKIMLATEFRDLMTRPPMAWSSLEGIKPLKNTIVPWSPEVAELRFMDRFRELTGGRLE